MRRRRFRHQTFEQNLAAAKARTEAQVATLKHGPQREALLKK
jgi:hypothetical protein